MRRFVDHVLCTLPFEHDWYVERGVNARYIGHPYFDELLDQQLDAAFLAEQQDRPGTVIGLLPGSRNLEVERNLSTMVRSAARIHAARPDTRFLVAGYKPAHARYIEGRLRGRNLPIEVHAGRTPEIIHLAHACIAVSGSVGLELLYRGKPSVVVYRLTRPQHLIGRILLDAPYISLVNLLAGRELFPEYATVRCEAQAVSGHLLRWLNDPAAHGEVCGELAELRRRVAEPGACERAARYLLAEVDKQVEKVA
jgi:lipid-A-disaccharide synthase